MSGRMMSGTSVPSLGHDIFALFSFISQANSHSKRSLGTRLEVREILVPDVGDQPRSEPIFWEGVATKHFSVKKKGFSVKRGEAIQ